MPRARASPGRCGRLGTELRDEFVKHATRHYKAGWLRAFASESGVLPCVGNLAGAHATGTRRSSISGREHWTARCCATTCLVYASEAHGRARCRVTRVWGSGLGEVRRARADALRGV